MSLVNKTLKSQEEIKPMKMIGVIKNKTGRTVKMVALGTAMTLLSVLPLQQASAADKIRWKVQSTFNTGWPALGDPIAYLAKTLDMATDGRIKLKVYEPGKIVPPLEITPSISR
ncbi:MAG: TRAP-type mannitol/chloroaromatic compound transport system substrate-binding protein, partial [Gammaproteobacteria bacterium]